MCGIYATNLLFTEKEIRVKLKIVHNLNIPKFKKMLNNHMDGNVDYKSYIWRVYVLIKWMKNDKKNNS
tara:strand:+ start:20 stop:223 length:204 start_codon:yes stop_codon:yes gene_type:complete